MSHLFNKTLTGSLRLQRLRPSLLHAKIIYQPNRGRIMASTAQPQWRQPQPSYNPADINLSPPLKVYNSLTRSKDDFIPEKKDVVSW
jgi:hypothetical protein